MALDIPSRALGFDVPYPPSFSDGASCFLSQLFLGGPGFCLHFPSPYPAYCVRLHLRASHSHLGIQSLWNNKRGAKKFP